MEKKRKKDGSFSDCFAHKSFPLIDANTFPFFTSSHPHLRTPPSLPIVPFFSFRDPFTVTHRLTAQQKIKSAGLKHEVRKWFDYRSCRTCKTKKYREGESRKKIECVHLKWKNDRLTQLCVFGYKVGRTIFTAFHPPQNQTPKSFVFRFDKEKSRKSTLIVFFIETSHHIFHILTGFSPVQTPPHS